MATRDRYSRRNRGTAPDRVGRPPTYKPGSHFGALILLSRLGDFGMFECTACGATAQFRIHNVVYDGKQDCGCIARAEHARRILANKEELSRHEIFRQRIMEERLRYFHRELLSRCEDPAHPLYKYYGALGITVCERWHNFECFALDMSQANGIAKVLKRVDLHDNYEPAACRWPANCRELENDRDRIVRDLKITTWVESEDEKAKKRRQATLDSAFKEKYNPR